MATDVRAVRAAKTSLTVEPEDLSISSSSSLGHPRVDTLESPVHSPSHLESSCWEGFCQFFKDLFDSVSSSVGRFFNWITSCFRSAPQFPEGSVRSLAALQASGAANSVMLILPEDPAELEAFLQSQEVGSRVRDFKVQHEQMPSIPGADRKAIEAFVQKYEGRTGFTDKAKKKWLQNFNKLPACAKEVGKAALIRAHARELRQLMMQPPGQSKQKTDATQIRSEAESTLLKSHPADAALIDALKQLLQGSKQAEKQ